MADVMKRVKKEIKSDKKGKSADKKPNTQIIRRKKYSTVLRDLQEGSQPYNTLKHMIQKGRTTSLEMATLLYITNPTAVISYLRLNKCCDISTHYEYKKNASGKEKRIGVFTLEV